MKDYARAIIDLAVAEKQRSRQEGNPRAPRRLKRRLQLGNVRVAHRGRWLQMLM
jgi:hypothetical protein